MKPLNIFISRKMSNESPFRKLLESQLGNRFKLNIKDHSGIAFNSLPFLLNKKFDACCFYSKRAVQFFLQEIPECQEILKDKFIIAFGPATAAQLNTYNLAANIIGNGKAVDLANDITRDFKGKSILFPQAQNSKQSLFPLLQDKFDCINLSVYSNEILTLPIVQEFDYLVFTSPMNVESYLINNSLHGKIIAIGETTAAYLKEKTELEIIQADQPSELELAKAIVKLI